MCECSDDEACGKKVLVESCMTVGFTVERALKLLWQPSPGKLSIDLANQAPSDHTEVRVSRVLVPGTRRPRNSTRVKVYENDALLALRAVRAVMVKLDEHELQVVRVDQRHEDAEGQPSHDAIAKPAYGSHARKGFRSVEIRCREVISKRAYVEGLPRIELLEASE